MFKAFYLSFFSKAFYCDVASNWRGIAFSLLLAIVTLHSIFFVIHLYRGYSDFLSNQGTALVEQIPAISIVDGKMRIDKPWPYTIKSQDGTPLVLFDVNFDETKFPAGRVWITSDKIYIRRNAYDEMRVYSLKRVEHFSLDKILVQDWLKLSKKWFLAVLFPIVLIGFLIARMIQVGIYSLIGLGLNKIMGVYLTYLQIFRLCVAALVPVLLIDCVLLAVHPVNWPWIGFFLAMGYLVYGLRANRDLIR
jgi:hypothetical protein